MCVLLHIDVSQDVLSLLTCQVLTPLLDGPMRGPRLSQDIERFLTTISQSPSGYMASYPTLCKQNLIPQKVHDIASYISYKDASYLPWVSVREAGATSVHDIEEGMLEWGDTIQWSINRLGASRSAYSGSNIQPVHPRTRRSPEPGSRICTHFIEGRCRRLADHGIYRHPCISCSRMSRLDMLSCYRMT